MISRLLPAERIADVEVVHEGRAINGECPGWDDVRRRLYWVDMRRPTLNALDLATHEVHHWEMPAWIGCYGVLDDGRLIVALRTGLALFDPRDGSLTGLAPAPYDARRFCFNDGGCDRHGHFIVGPMYHPLGPDDANAGAPRKGPLFRLDCGALSSLDLPPVQLSNGLAFSPDGRTLYHSDTAARTIWACDYDAETGHTHRQRVFARVEEGGDTGGPDGAAVDRDGFYLCAVFGGGCLLRFDPEGALERRIELPVQYPTMPAFGGADRSTLYVTSASFPMRRHGRAPGGLDGMLLSLQAPVPGLPTSYAVLDGGDAR